MSLNTSFAVMWCYYRRQDEMKYLCNRMHEFVHVSAIQKWHNLNFGWHHLSIYLPDKVKMQYMCISDYILSFTLENSRKRSMLVNNWSSNHIKHISIQAFTMGVDWLKIWRLLEVSTMFDICTYCVFTLYGSHWSM